jgi:hypothetical protein
MDYLRQLLKAVTQMTLEAEMAGVRWVGQGGVACHVTADGDGVIFDESGVWHTTSGKVQPFVNQYIWLFDDVACHCLLYRKRAEAEAPECLARLIQSEACHTGQSLWIQATPHVCGEDNYIASLSLSPTGHCLSWSICGPKKRDYVRILYR